MTQTQTPEVTWAQRSSDSDPAKNIVYLTVFAPDVPDSKLKVDLKPTSLTVEGESTTKKVNYKVHLDFFDEVDIEESKKAHTARDVVFVLRKKEAKAEFWPRLTKEKARLHFLKTDFDRWVDEDEQEEGKADDLDMSGGDFGGIDFSKLAGGGGMPDLGAMGGMGGMGGMDMSSFAGAGGEGDEDEDMPALEGEEEGKEAAAEPTKTEEAEEAAKPKIEEVA